MKDVEDDSENIRGLTRRKKKIEVNELILREQRRRVMRRGEVVNSL